VDGYSRLTEVEAYGPAVAADNGVHWLVTDQLGTPRMIFDQSGSLTVLDQNGNYASGMTRHDYLPFGEELFAGTGGRTTAQGYSASDGVRQHFTLKERDNETGLDYFLARYYSSTQGRFTSADPLYYTANRPGDPQQFNLYAYVRNNPLGIVDPDGKDGQVVDSTTGLPANQADREQVQRDLRRIAPGTRVDNNGVIHRAGFFHRVLNHLTGHGAGTALVTRIVNSSQTTTIAIVPGLNNGGTNPTNLAASQAGQATGATIQYDPGITAGWPTRMPDAHGNVTNTSPIQDQTPSSAVLLGHELVHADHIMRGNVDFSTGDHDFREGSTNYRENYLREEFRTVGFKGYTRSGDTTENQLRRELGENPRAAYIPRPYWQTIP